MALSPTLRSALPLLALVLAVGGGTEVWRHWQSGRTGSEVAALARPGDIEMIASDTCVFCAQARDWFQDNGVPFTECSIERDAACAERFRALMSPGTPVLLVRGQAQVGFSPQRVVQALGG